MTIRVRPSAYAIVPLDLAALDAFDNTNGMTMAVDGRTELIVQNTDVGARTVTLTSTADPYGRTKDVTAYSIAAGAFAFFPEFPQIGWAASSGLLAIAGSGANLKYVALQRAAGT